MSVGGSASDLETRLLNEVAQSYAWRDPVPPMVGVMVSGGGDSMALLHLMHRAGRLRGWRVEAITVDHGLRAEAAGEAAMVAQVCAGLGIAHQISVWDHGDITGNLMNQARRARYKLVAEWAHQRGIADVVLGHTADDQAETFLMGLARKSGLDGLSGMRVAWPEHEIGWLRPLLSVTRADLRQYLRTQGLAWVEDPSNDDEGFARVKARRVLQALRPLGITAATLAGVSDNLAMARGAIGWQLARTSQMVTQTAAGSLSFSRDQYLALPMEIQRRLLIAALRWTSGVEYPPRESGLMAVQWAIAVQKDATLGGVRFKTKADAIHILREAKAVQSLGCPTTQLWDNRWQLTGPHGANLSIRALGSDGLSLCKDWRATGHPRDALLVTPAIWQGQTLIAAPLAGFSNDWCANCGPSFASFVLSH
ncbi:MAG: tRNA lysidine(34) synthetase TilS [Cypionkella sp.]